MFENLSLRQDTEQELTWFKHLLTLARVCWTSQKIYRHKLNIYILKLKVNKSF